MTEPPAKIPFRCRRCGHAVAETDGESIYFGGKPVPLEPLRIQFICPNCRCEVRWNSNRQGMVLTEKGV